MHAYEMDRPDPSDHASTATDSFAQPKRFHFGSFCAIPASRLLLRQGTEVAIGGRAFDLLIALLRARGQVVGKNEIVRVVWPSTNVAECNIRFQVGALRKILGSDGDLIKTIPGRGYLMVDREPDSGGQRTDPTPNSSISNLLPDWLKPGFDGRSPANPITPYVALVDDDATVLEALASLVRSAGFHVQAFLSTSDFLNSVQTCPPSCVVLDAWMPGQGGLDFQASMIRAGVHLPIVFISGHADIAMSVRAIKAGALDFLTKPVRYDDLLNAICLAMATTNGARTQHGVASARRRHSFR